MRGTAWSLHKESASGTLGPLETRELAVVAGPGGYVDAFETRMAAAPDALLKNSGGRMTVTATHPLYRFVRVTGYDLAGRRAWSASGFGTVSCGPVRSRGVYLWKIDVGASLDGPSVRTIIIRQTGGW